MNFQEASQLAVKRSQESGTPLTGKETSADIYLLAGIDQPRAPRYQSDGSPLRDLAMSGDTEVSQEREGDIRTSVRDRFQGAIDSIMASFSGQLAAEEQRGRERAGETRAASSYFGTAGAPTGAAEKERTGQYNKQQMADIESRRDLAIQNVFLQIEDRADKLIAAEKEEALGAKQTQIAYLADERDNARQNVKDLAAQGVSLEDIEQRFPNDVQNILTQTGWSPFELTMAWEANKPKAEQIDWNYSWRGDTMVATGQDPKTGELVTKTFTAEELGIPAEEKPINPSFMTDDVSGQTYWWDKDNPQTDEAGNLVMKPLGKFGESIAEQEARLRRRGGGTGGVTPTGEPLFETDTGEEINITTVAGIKRTIELGKEKGQPVSRADMRSFLDENTKLTVGSINGLLDEAFGEEKEAEETFLSKNYFKGLFTEDQLKKSAKEAGCRSIWQKWAVEKDDYLNYLMSLVDKYRDAGHSDKAILKMMQ